ncbi:uncharacterized protein LOC131666491 [Phymastichus coffea]|uniref:uncharacterized protein LOC131666491 n=1 Tax=Phymastichus coffea TaxID=108790 RepID=UPI00273C895C|nr:uncharacterized protein LOC131666491 [Phymastichus coffea]
MSNLSKDKFFEQSRDEYVPEIDKTNYFQEQDEKFEELHKNLQKLKEDNKKQIDAIIDSLDDLMASKCVIEQTLDKIISDDLPIEIPKENLSVVDLLAKVTGIVNDPNDSLFKECERKNDSAVEVNKEELKTQTSNKMNCTNDMPKKSKLTKQTEENSLINLEDCVLQDCKNEYQNETSDKVNLTDNTDNTHKVLKKDKE